MWRWSIRQALLHTDVSTIYLCSFSYSTYVRLEPWRDRESHSGTKVKGARDKGFHISLVSDCSCVLYVTAYVECFTAFYVGSKDAYF